VVKARGQTGQHGGATGHLLYVLKQRVCDGLDVHEALTCSLVREREDSLFRVVQDKLRFVLFLQRFARNLVAGFDQLPQHGLVADDCAEDGTLCFRAVRQWPFKHLIACRVTAEVCHREVFLKNFWMKWPRIKTKKLRARRFAFNAPLQKERPRALAAHYTTERL